MTDEELLHASKVATNAVKEAGAYLLAKQPHAQVVGEKSKRDQVLDADLGAEQILVSRIRKTFPGQAILSEEAGNIGSSFSFLWVIDPLDGSFNYIHGRNDFGVMATLLVYDNPVVSAVFLPSRDELFVARRGRGATRNGQKVVMSQTQSLKEALIHFGDFSKYDNGTGNDERLADISKLASSIGRVRMVGSATVDFGDMACGRADGLIVRNIPKWDIAAGQLLIQEAHGVFKTFQDRDESELFIFSNSKLHRKLAAILRS
jgi:myo-inositol-1(or 4)-monophosphatase